MKDNNPVLQKSKTFAIRCVRLYQFLTSEKREKSFPHSCFEAEQA